MLTQESITAAHSSEEEIWRKLVQMISEADEIVLTTHENSDGDGLGSQVGLYHALKQLGKEVYILNPTEIPSNYRFLFQDFQSVSDMFYSSENQVHQAIMEKADLLLVLDTNSIDRTRGLKDVALKFQASGKLKIGCVDHHLEPQGFADVMICLSYASATGELIYDLITYYEKFLNRTLFNIKSAIGIYTALMTDTGSFRFPKTTPHVHAIAAKMIELGAVPNEIHKQVYSIPYSAMKLIGLAINNIQLEMNGRIGFLLITRQMFQQTSTTQSDTERITEYLMSLDCIEVGLVFVEQENGTVKVSLRSHGDIYVNEVAKKFGGGGHKNAAGCRLELPIYKAMESVLIETQQLLKEPYLNTQEEKS